MRKVFVMLAMLFFLTGSCGSEETTQDEFDRMIEQEVKNRLDHWAAVKRRNCEQALLEEATIIVDSIVLEQARQAAAQKEKPPKPIKPEHPEPLDLPDSLPLKPIFESGDSSQELSFGRLGQQSLENDDVGALMGYSRKPISRPDALAFKCFASLKTEKSRHAIN